MAIYQFTQIFEGPGHGFEESMFFRRTTEDLDAAMAWVLPITDKRVKLLGTQYYMKGCRVMMYANNANVHQVRRGKRMRFFKDNGGLDRPGEDTGTSLQVLMQDSIGEHSKLTYLGGPWAMIFPFANAYDPNAGGWLSYFNAWAQMLRDKGMGWLSATVIEEATITSYTSDPDTGHVSFALQTPGINWPVLNVATTVSVEFPLGRSALDGRYQVVPTSNTAAITAKPRPSAAFVLNGRMKLQGRVLVTLDTLNNQGNAGTVVGEVPVSRKRGRPLLVNRGRRPATVRF